MNVKNHTIGILGSGWVAEKMAITLAGMKGYECLAIASRTQAHADDFATKHGIARSYGSYEELVKDDDVELVYIATPHAYTMNMHASALSTINPYSVKSIHCQCLRAEVY